MDKFSDRLKAALSIRNMSAAELSRIIGVNEGTISNYKKGTYEPKQRRLENIAAALRVSIPWLMGGDVPMEQTAPNLYEYDDDSHISRGVKIPVLGCVRAGYPMFAEENILDYEEITPEMAARGTYFCLRIKGDSMEPQIMEGDTVVVRQQPIVENGEIAIMLINGNEATCKKFRRTEEGITLISFNPVYEPMFFTPKEVNELPVQVIGKVVELRRSY